MTSDLDPKEFYESFAKAHGDGIRMTLMRIADDLAAEGYKGIVNLRLDQVVGYPNLFPHRFYTVNAAADRQQHEKRVAEVAARHLGIPTISWVVVSDCPHRRVTLLAQAHGSEIVQTCWYLPVGGRFVPTPRPLVLPIGAVYDLTLLAAILDLDSRYNRMYEVLGP